MGYAEVARPTPVAKAMSIESRAARAFMCPRRAGGMPQQRRFPGRNARRIIVVCFAVAFPMST